VPVVSFDGPAGEERKTKRNRTRVVVFHAITQVLKSGYYGILTQGFPQLVRVNPDVLGFDTEHGLPAGFPALCRARMIHEFPLIPDVERLEHMIAELPAGA
jgi:chemosensory pili system protein ChpC